MGPTELTARVSRDACVLGAAVAAPAAWLGGLDGALAAAAGIAVGNFRWLAARVTTPADGSAGRALWAVSAMLRLSVLAAAVTLAILSGHAHPLGIIAGLSVLPVAIITRGLRDARSER